jgi:lipopolysaccharide export system protein LptA
MKNSNICWKNGLHKNKKRLISVSTRIGKIAISKEMDGFKNNKQKTTLFLLLFVATTFFGMPQNPPPTENGKVTKILVENADSIELSKNNNPDIWVLRGNVIFKHDSIYMYCDSAYLYDLTNSLEAFSNVRIIQGDTLSMYGDYLNYEANINLAKMRENVRMENDDVTLFTDNFDYDRNKNIAYYFKGGMLVDSINELTSINGQYSPDTKIAFFKEQVHLINPQFDLTSDTLKYHTETKIATILGPTVIEADSGMIHSTRGWYNTITEESMLYDRSLVISKDKTKNITADSIFYNKVDGLIEAFGDMVLNDSLKSVILLGNYGYYDENTKFAFATDSAQLIEFSRKDSLFLHADTLQMETFDEEREVKAFHAVRFYRIDIQGICDSLQFNTGDSILNLYKNPILWNTGYQINGDTIKILFNDTTIEKMDVLNYAFVMEELDTTCYNQLKGKNLITFFIAGELNKMDVSGNAEAIYYPLSDDKVTYSGRHKIEAPFMYFIIQNRKIAKISWFPEPKVETLPIPFLDSENRFLKGFKNYNYLRPQNREDIFTEVKMKAEDVPPPRRVRQHQHTE